MTTRYESKTYIPSNEILWTALSEGNWGLFCMLIPRFGTLLAFEGGRVRATVIRISKIYGNDLNFT